MYDYKLLKGYIIARYGGVKEFAAAIGWSLDKVYRRLSNRAEFALSEIEYWADTLQIPADQIQSAFFTPAAAEL